MKKLVSLFSHSDNKSYFKEETPEYDTNGHLGLYTKKIKVNGMKFRTFNAGMEYSWHNAPQPQYIIYLEGEVEVEASGGEKRIFKKGYILFAADMTGQGHVTRTLTSGNSIVVTTMENEKEETYNSFTV